MSEHSTCTGELVKLRIEGLRVGTRDYKPRLGKLVISKMANEPFQLRRDVTTRAGIEHIPPIITPDDEDILFDDEGGDDRIPSQQIPDDD